MFTVILIIRSISFHRWYKNAVGNINSGNQIEYNGKEVLKKRKKFYYGYLAFICVLLIVMAVWCMMNGLTAFAITILVEIAVVTAVIVPLVIILNKSNLSVAAMVIITAFSLVTPVRWVELDTAGEAVQPEETVLTPVEVVGSTTEEAVPSPQLKVKAKDTVVDDTPTIKPFLHDASRMFGYQIGYVGLICASLLRRIDGECVPSRGRYHRCCEGRISFRIEDFVQSYFVTQKS